MALPQIDSELLFAGWSQPDLEDAINGIENSIAAGVLRVESPDGTRTEYRSVDDMVRVVNKMKLALAYVTGDASAIGADRPIGNFRPSRRRWRRFMR